MTTVVFANRKNGRINGLKSLFRAVILNLNSWEFISVKQIIFLGLVAFSSKILAKEAKVVTFPTFKSGECLVAFFADDGSAHHKTMKINEIANSEKAKKEQTLCDAKTAEMFSTKKGSCYVFCNPNRK